MSAFKKLVELYHSYMQLLRAVPKDKDRFGSHEAADAFEIPPSILESIEKRIVEKPKEIVNSKEIILKPINQDKRFENFRQNV